MSGHGDLTAKSAEDKDTAHEHHEGLECLVFTEFTESLGSLGSPEAPECPASPVSNGQELRNELERWAALCACTCSEDIVKDKRFELVRRVKALEKQTGWRLSTSDRLFVFKRWYDASQTFLDPAEDHLAAFLAAIPKVRVPWGEGDTLNQAIENVSKLSFVELPTIPQIPNPRESWRRLVALHCELSRLSTNKDKTYFLSTRDAAKAFPDLSHQTAHQINLALVELGVIEITRVGDKRQGGKATEFRYLLATTIPPF